jgi:hypothetical protein
MICMANGPTGNFRSQALRPLADAGGRAAGATLRPLTGAVAAAAEAGINLERRVIDRLLDSGEIERLLDSPRLQAIVKQLMRSEGAAGLIDMFVDSGLLDRFIDRLLSTDGLWRLVDEIAASPAVTAAISQQGLGFADQLGGALREGSRKADQRVERTAHHLTRRNSKGVATDPDASRQR